MSVVAFFSARATASTSCSMSTSRSLTLCSSRTSSSGRRGSTSSGSSASTTSTSASASTPNQAQSICGGDIRCLSTTTNQQQNFKHKYTSNVDQDSSLARKALIGLTAAGVATIGASSTLDDKVNASCESDASSSTSHPFYDHFGESLRTLLWMNNQHDKENIKVPLGNGSELRYEPSPATSSSSIPGRMIDVVKASVDTANEWEKKAKQTVMRMAQRPYPESYDVSVRALRGDRLSMEDKFSIHNDGRFAAVFDGHGGGCVSTYLSETLFDKINQHLKKSKGDAEGKEGHDSLTHLTNTLKSSFREVDQEILKNDEYQYQGSTAVAIWVHEDGDKGRTLVSANVGDSRAVLSHQGRAVDMTKDHKPNDAEEKKRIMSMGEKIEWDAYSNVHRVRNLSLSRAIGDKFAKPVVSSEVDIKTFSLEDSGSDDFVVLASDGLWDVMTSQGCVDYINERLNPSKEQLKNMSTIEAQRQKFTKRKTMSRFVANEALKRGSCDNVCVIIVWLNKPDDETS